MISVAVLVASKRERVPEWKKEIVSELVELIKISRAVLVADLTGVPSRHVQ
ncbi:MAG: 50S ribosomal protein L10, partial [Desulfurococcaceae archaeon]